MRGLERRKRGKDVPGALLKREGRIDQQIEVISKSSTTDPQKGQPSPTIVPEVKEIVLVRGSPDVYASIQELVVGLTRPLKMYWREVEERVGWAIALSSHLHFARSWR